MIPCSSLSLLTDYLQFGKTTQHVKPEEDSISEYHSQNPRESASCPPVCECSGKLRMSSNSYSSSMGQKQTVSQEDRTVCSSARHLRQKHLYL